MAISANGIIATEDGNEEFISEASWDYFVKHVNQVGCTIWGMNTQKAVLKWPQSYFDDVKNVTKIFISRNKQQSVSNDFIHATDIYDALAIAEKQGFGEVVLSSGGMLNTEFAKRKLIDEVVLTIDSVLVGKGIPLFSPQVLEIDLHLESTQKIGPETIALHYTVIKE